MALEIQPTALYLEYPLDDAHSQIRLLIVRPGDWEDQISCDFEVVSLDDGPVYTALSYVWGRDDLDHIVSIGGCRIPIRPNLFAALRRLRAHSMGKDSIIWVDAVCINQTSIQERSSQVAMMGRIYSSCANVSVWFGELEFASEIWPDVPINTNPGRCYTVVPAEKQAESKEDIDIIFGNIPEWEGVLRVATYLSLMAANNSISSHTGTLVSYSLIGNEHLEKHFTMIIRALERNEWFNRVWVIQEFILAPSVTMYIGPVAMPSTVFSSAQLQYQSYIGWPYAAGPESHEPSCRTLLNTGITKLVEYSALRDRIRNHNRNQTILELRLQLSRRLASVDLDQVYALYGVAGYLQSHFKEHRERKSEMDPDYNNSPEDTYTEISLVHLQESLSFLALSLSSYKHNYPNTPSWVIDWSVLQSDSIRFDHRLWTGMYDEYRADRGIHETQPRFSGHSMFLTVQGIFVDEIMLVARYNDTSELSSLVEELKRHEPNSLYHGCQTTWAEAYFRTILADGVRSYSSYKDENNSSLALRRLARVYYDKEILQRLPFILHPYSPWEIEDPDTFSDDWDRNSVSEDTRVWGKCEWRGVNNDIPPASPTVKDLQNLSRALKAQAKGILNERTLFFTRSGYLGITHKCVSGDRIYIVKGGRTPIILQELPKPDADILEQRKERLKIDPRSECNFVEGRQYRVVSDCYLHGFMDGEHNERLLDEQEGLSVLSIL